MPQLLKVQLEDEDGNIYYLHTSGDSVFLDDGRTVQAAIEQTVRQSAISNVQVNDSSKVPSAALAYAMQQQITWNEDAIRVLNSDIADSLAAIALNSSQDFFTNDYNYIVRFGKARVLRIYMTAVHGSTASGIQIATLEPGDRPKIDAYGVIQNVEGPLSCMCSVISLVDGRIIIYPLQELSADVIIGGTLT